MTVQIVHASPDGRLIVPKEVTEALKVIPDDNFLLVGDEESILLKRVVKPDLKMRASQVMDEMSRMFESHNITEDDVVEEINAVRRNKYS